MKHSHGTVLLEKTLRMIFPTVLSTIAKIMLSALKACKKQDLFRKGDLGTQI